MRKLVPKRRDRSPAAEVAPALDHDPLGAGKATAAPHSGAAGPAHARKWFVWGDRMMTCACGRGSPG